MIPSCMKRLCVCGKSSNTKSNADGDITVSSQRSWNCFSRKKRKRITTAKTAQSEEKKSKENAHQEELEHIGEGTNHIVSEEHVRKLTLLPL